MLRFLQERIIERLGGHKEIPVDVRIVCATHDDLGESIKAGRFREDLYYRVSEIVIQVPALRERNGDGVVLAKTFLDKYARENGRSYRGFTSAALERIEAYGWPGNVRELENRVKRAVVLADGGQITAEDLGFEAADNPLLLDLRAAREAAERMVIEKALVTQNYNMSQTAAVLGISRPSLYNLMNKLGMECTGK